MKRRRGGENVVWNPDTNSCELLAVEEPVYRLIAYSAAPSTISVSLTGQISQVNTAYSGAANLAQQVTVWLRPAATQRAQRRTVTTNAQGTFRELWTGLDTETAYVTSAQGPDGVRITRTFTTTSDLAASGVAVDVAVSRVTSSSAVLTGQVSLPVGRAVGRFQVGRDVRGRTEWRDAGTDTPDRNGIATVVARGLEDNTTYFVRFTTSATFGSGAVIVSTSFTTSPRVVIVLPTLTLTATDQQLPGISVVVSVRNPRVGDRARLSYSRVDGNASGAGTLILSLAVSRGTGLATFRPVLCGPNRWNVSAEIVGLPSTRKSIVVTPRLPLVGAISELERLIASEQRLFSNLENLRDNSCFVRDTVNTALRRVDTVSSANAVTQAGTIKNNAELIRVQLRGIRSNLEAISTNIGDVENALSDLTSTTLSLQDTAAIVATGGIGIGLSLQISAELTAIAREVSILKIGGPGGLFGVNVPALTSQLRSVSSSAAAAGGILVILVVLGPLLEAGIDIFNAPRVRADVRRLRPDLESIRDTVTPICNQATSNLNLSRTRLLRDNTALSQLRADQRVYRCV